MENTYRIKYQSKLYDLPYTVIRSRKPCGISICPDGILTLRVPLGTTDKEIQNILLAKQHWIITHYLKLMEQAKNRPASDLSDTQRSALEKRYLDAAREYFPKRAAYFQTLTGHPRPEDPLGQLQCKRHPFF